MLKGRSLRTHSTGSRGSRFADSCEPVKQVSDKYGGVVCLDRFPFRRNGVTAKRSLRSGANGNLASQTEPGFSLGREAPVQNRIAKRCGVIDCRDSGLTSPILTTCAPGSFANPCRLIGTVTFEWCGTLYARAW